MIKNKAVILFIVMILAALSWNLDYCQPVRAENNPKASEDKKTTIDIDFDKEDKEVGLKRMEILDKMLSPGLLEKKRAIMSSIEEDYTQKITTLLQRLTSPISRNMVVTHLNINFFDPGFETQIQATQKVSVSIILDRNGLENWASEKRSEEEALEEIKQMIYSTFKIPMENISIIKAPN